MNEEHDSISVGAAEGLGFGSRSAEANPTPQRSPRPAQAAQAAAEASSHAPAAPDPIEQSVAQINSRLAEIDRVLILRVNPQTGLTVAEITNASTGQVLQQIPSPDLLHLAALLQSWAHGASALVDMIA
jgi:uncharacterized FlaG/YvyC family protein